MDGELPLLSWGKNEQNRFAPFPELFCATWIFVIVAVVDFVVVDFTIVIIIITLIFVIITVIIIIGIVSIITNVITIIVFYHYHTLLMPLSVPLL